jgi:hypothetical protein
MPETKNKTTAQKIMYIAGAVAAIASALSGFSYVKSATAEYFHEEVTHSVKDQVELFESEINDIKSIVSNHIEEKNKSKSIGLRVHSNGQLYYRAENLKEYPAYKDVQMSEDYNYPYYYYINPINGEKEWCK